MNISLFGQALVLIAFGLVVGLTIYLCSKIDVKLRLIVLTSMIVLGIILSLILVYLTANITQSANELPGKFWLMIFPFTFSILILPGIFGTNLYVRKKTKPKRGRKKKVEAHVARTVYIISLASINIVVALAFVLIMTNSYYHYYPTIDTIFGVGASRTAVLSQENKITFQYSNIGSLGNTNTIEASIYNKNPVTNQGVLYSLNIPGKVSGFATRSGYIYVPSIAFNQTSLVKLPVLVLLPGFPGFPSDVIGGADFGTIITKFAKLHHGITPLVYIADDDGVKYTDTECVNSSRGNVETYLAVDVPNYIKSHFNVSDNPDNWAIGGISMGGTCAVMLTLTNPNIYHYFIDIGGDVGPSLVGSLEYTIKNLFNGSETAYNQHQPLYLLATKKYKGLGGFFGNGGSDTPDVTTGTTLLYNASKQDGLDVVHETVNGSHTFNIFSELLKEAIPWASNRLGATECSGTLICQ